MLLTALLPPFQSRAASPEPTASREQQTLERVHALIEQGQLQQARQALEPWLTQPYSAASLPFLYALAALYEHTPDAVAEAATYHDIILLAPQDSRALRGRVFATQRLGAPHLAAALAAQTPALFSATERRHLQQALAGKSIQWGTVESHAGLGPQRFQATDRGIAQSAAVSGDDLVGRYASFDRIVALRDRVRMDEAIALYQALRRRQIDLPAYALAAVAEAYMYNHEPEQARALYQQALTLSQHDPSYPNRDWQFGLFEAYMDANDFAAARQLSEQLQRDIPALVHRGLPGVELDNDFYARAQISAARLRLATNALAESQSMLQQLLQAAPFNLDTRLTYGDLLQAREQPRAAQQQYVSVLVDDPTNVSAAVGIAETALELYDLGLATTQLDALTANYPEQRAVQRLQRQLQAFTRPRFSLTSEAGRSASGAGNTGNSDWQLEALFHSGVFADHWRIFLHSFSAQASFDEETARRLRLGIGAEYLGPEWQFGAEISHTNDDPEAVGVSLRSTWSLSDHWQLGAEFDSQSNEIPLRASAAGIDARALTLQALYTHHESRHWQASLGQAWFSDGNRRTQVGMRWTERWLSRPRYTLETQLGFDTSMNSRRDVVYFNPRRDYTLDLTLIQEWWLWRRYEREFKQRLLLGAGPYWQQGFASGAAFTLRYEQEWNLASRRSLRYGVAYRQQPFDGVDDQHLFFFLDMAWHF